MKKILIIVAFLILNSANAQQITSAFNTDADGWIVIGDATSAVPNYLNEGGNPGGYVSADDTATGGVWYWSAPAKFLGDQSTSLGKNLSFDLKQSAITSQFDDIDVSISNGSTTIVLDLADNPGIDWTSYSVTLDMSTLWKIDNIITGEIATSEQILAVLSNIISLKIRGEYVSGSDTGGLDNVILQNNLLAVSSVSTPKISLYPNPTTGLFNVASDLILQDSTIEVLDLSGKIVFTDFKFKAKKPINISSLKPGVYLVKMKYGDKTFSQRIIKQ